MRGQANEKACKYNWLPPFKPSLTPIQFARLTAARDAQVLVAKQQLQDSATSAQKASKSGDEQDDSTGIDRLSSLCNHDVASMLRALKAVPSNPQPTQDWLGTPAQRERAAQKLAARLQLSAHSAAGRVPAGEHDRISDTGGSMAHVSGPDSAEVRAAPHAPATSADAAAAALAGAPAAKAASKPQYDPQEHIRKLESKVLEQRKRAEREKAQQEVKAARRAARKAQVPPQWCHSANMLGAGLCAIIDCLAYLVAAGCVGAPAQERLF